MSDIFKGAGLSAGGIPFQGVFAEILEEAGFSGDPSKMTFDQKTEWIPKIKDKVMEQFSAKEEGYAAEGKIPSLTNIKDAPVYITTSQQDEKVHPKIAELQKEFYTQYEANLEFLPDANEGHKFLEDLPRQQL